MSDQPVQLRIGFELPTSEVRLSLALNGMWVAVKAMEGQGDLAHQHLVSVGAHVSVDPQQSTRFPVQDLALLTALPAHVHVEPSGQDMETLWGVVRYSRPGEPPVVVREDAHDMLNVTWQSHGVTLNEPLSSRAASALIALGVPIVAPDGTWETLLRASSLPQVIARARVNLDGFIEIHSTAPQRLELSPTPGLFRLDESRFGVPLAFGDAVRSIPGVVWEGGEPVWDNPPEALAGLPLSLSGHVDADLRELVDSLARFRGQVVSWSPGLGRRILCAAAVESLDAYPLLVLTHPSALWLWQRNFEALGRATSMLGPGPGVHVATYEQFAAATAIGSPPASVIFDDLDRVVVGGGPRLSALHRLDGLSESFRVACVRNIPEKTQDLLEFMSVVRPVEFRSGIPAALRYPPDSATRAREHASCYVLGRNAPAGTMDVFRRSRVEVLAAPDELCASLAALASEPLPASERAERSLSVVSGGSPSMMSPKVTAAFEHLRKASSSGERTAVVTVHERTARMLVSLMRGLGVHFYDKEAAAHLSPAVVLAESVVPDLSSYDKVVFLDYLLSGRSMDAAVGSAQGDRGPRHTIVLHLDHPVDDRMAVICAARRERSGSLDVGLTGPSGLSAVEAAYVLGQ